MTKNESLRPIFFFFLRIKTKIFDMIRILCYSNVPKKIDINFENKNLQYI